MGYVTANESGLYIFVQIVIDWQRSSTSTDTSTSEMLIQLLEGFRMWFQRLCQLDDYVSKYWKEGIYSTECLHCISEIKSPHWGNYNIDVVFNNCLGGDQHSSKGIEHLCSLVRDGSIQT